MTHPVTDQPHIIECPVCDAHGAMLHHDVRAPLVYSCLKCMHEWQIDPAEEPAEAELGNSPVPRKGER
jgi:hypothetical protein